ncbi:hypothetical protein H0H81_000717 [Sphagnurus paluster]|uniref:MARVEL domain-containing protein n=1 Tax=Sphagnurus paluster TaxID=117069 RepID=A0A9P7FQ39_9AGAR|nr:hypothetical protein H0H81_000717 [Sphagnurus paluster]
MPPHSTILSTSLLTSPLKKRRDYSANNLKMTFTDVSRTHSNPSATKATYHPFLFSIMTLSAVAELGLTAFLVTAGTDNRTWPSARYHALLILFVFNAAWTTLFSVAYLLWFVEGATHLLASIASSVIWLLVTSILWTITDCRGAGMDRVWPMCPDANGYMLVGEEEQAELCE